MICSYIYKGGGDGAGDSDEMEIAKEKIKDM